MKSSVFTYIILALTALMISGCGKIDITIDKGILPIGIVNPFSAPAAAEIVSGSVSEALTPNNLYHVNATVGTMLKEVQATTLNGYQISYGLDGELVPVE